MLIFIYTLLGVVNLTTKLKLRLVYEYYDLIEN
jgi:hypothetical protein